MTRPACLPAPSIIAGLHGPAVGVSAADAAAHEEPGQLEHGPAGAGEA